jgi:hypothetical protein
MRKRTRKSKQLYYICVDKTSFEPTMFSTKRAVASYIGVNESTLYRQFLHTSHYEKDNYIVWCDKSIILCNKGLAS